MTLAIDVQNVHRVYQTKKSIFLKPSPPVEAVKGISFSVPKGEIFGFLGPNGAGKTTTIKMMSTLLLPTSGKILINGLDVAVDAKKIRKMINVVYGGDKGLYYRLTGYENLRYFANLYGLTRTQADERVMQALARVSLTNKKDQKVEGYSRGMKQRLHIARSLLNDPEIIFFDEPTIGLDPKSARELRTIVKELAAQGKTVLLTTHNMAEVEELCHRIAVVNKGKLVALESPNGLKAKMQQEDRIEFTLSDPDLVELENAQSLYPQMEVTPLDEQVFKVSLSVPEYLPFISKLSELFKQSRVVDIHVRQQTLEDAYLCLLEEAI